PISAAAICAILFQIYSGVMLATSTGILGQLG
ncbi:prepilin peptidase, partial [Mesorhizobium sp. M1C.F.Ca.ET.193.01.1.1]